jgi:hypothetical protein
MANLKIVITLTLTLVGVLAILNVMPSFAQSNTTADMEMPTNQSMSTNATAGTNSTVEMTGLEGESGQISGCKRCR